MRKQKKMKYINYIIIDGVKRLMDELSEEESDEIAIKLNDQAMRALGYVRVDETIQSEQEDELGGEKR